MKVFNNYLKGARIVNSKLLRNVLHNPLILPFYVPSLIFAFSQGLLVPVLPLYAGEFKVSYGLIGLVLAGEALGTMLGDVPAGMLLRRIGDKGVMALGLACAALSTVALIWAGSILAVFALRLLAGFGRAMYNISRHVYVVEAIPLANRGRAIALFGGIFRIGGFLGPAVGGAVAAAYSLKAPFLVFGLACSVAVLLVALFVRINGKVEAETLSDPKGHGSHLRSTLKTQYRVLLAAGSGQIFAQMIRGGRRIIIPLYGAEALGLDVQQIGFIISVAAAVDMSLFYPAGWVMDRWGRKFAVVPSFTIQAIGIGLIPLASGFLGLLLASSLMGFGNGIGSGTMMTVGGDLAPEGSRGEFLGIWRLIGDIGSSGGPLIAGAVADLLVLPAAAWAMSGAGLAAALIFIFFVPETLKTRRRITWLS